MKSASDSLVLFDIDGTLLRGAGPHHKRALSAGIRQVTGLEATLDGVDTAGMLDRDLLRNMLRAAGASDWQIEQDLIAVMACCEDLYCADCAATLAPFVCRGVREILAELQAAGAAIGLVTGNLSGIGWKKVELAGLRPFFRFGAFSEDGSTRSELVGVAIQRARELGLISPRACFSLIGDHANDIAAAKANGITAIAVATGLLSCAELASFQPDLLVEHLGQLDVREGVVWKNPRQDA